MWEPRANGDEGEEVVKPKEPEASAVVTRSADSISDKEPTSPVETSSQVKVTDMTTKLETRVQTHASSGEKDQSAEKPSETRRLRIAWPPPAGEVHSGTGALSPVTEGAASGRPWKAKWPPGDDLQLPFKSSEQAELKNLRRSSSLKERSRPFTIAAKPVPAAGPGPREPRRPLKSLLEWRASLEENKPEPQQVKQQEKKEQVTPQTSEDAVSLSETISEEDVETVPKQQDDRDEQREKAAADKRAAEDGSVRSTSPDISASPSPPLQPKQHRTSQDVGFWEEDKEGSDGEEMSAEDMIKRNRYYEEEEEDSDS